MDLTPEQWDRVKALFEAALEKPGGERSTFLATVTEEPVIRQEAERLLASYTQAGDFLSSSPLGLPLESQAQFSYRGFSSGDVLARRFKITRFLARGGMGEVYEAEDQELHELVALKAIRPELLQDARALERFRREVHLAKQVTHPNVCRIFDLFRHHLGGPDEGGSVVFVAMELLRGETLSEAFIVHGRMAAGEALPIALQMAAGLGAAHDVGVLHRDFKPGNVVLVRGAKGTRAVITDFGLALRSGVDSSMSGSLTETGESFGTPAYMSPEQVEGKPLTPASDVYSLGLVLYQMVTGARPFEDTTPLSMAVRRLREDPTPPRQLAKDLDPRWEAVILRCLERDPQRRFAHADEVAKALLGETPIRWRPRPKFWLAIAAIMVLCVAGVLTVTRILPRRQAAQATPSQSGPAQVSLRRSVAVLPFRNLSSRPETGWVATALAEMLTSELAAGEKIRLVPGENVARVTSELGVAASAALGRETLARLRENLGSDFIVAGSYLDLGREAGGQIRLDLRMQDASTGDMVTSVTEKGSELQMDDLVTRAGAELREKLGVGEITPSQAESVRASLPSDAAAMRLYSEGLAKLRELDALAARDALQKSAAVEPKFALVHSALAAAWSALGYDTKARLEAQKAYDLSAGLPREERISVQARNLAAQKQWDKAAESYRSLFDFFPDNVDYGLNLASALTHAGRGSDALSVTGALRRLPSPAGGDPRIDLQEAAAYDILANFS
jgi:eukaryotic-like serine/threonine-protein kinase